MLLKKCTIRIPKPSLLFSILVILSHLPMTSILSLFYPKLSLISTHTKEKEKRKKKKKNKKQK